MSFLPLSTYETGDHMIPISHKKHSGAALVISLIILIAMTILSITSLKSSSTEIAMAGNLRESAITFQAAEVGLKTAETLLENQNEPGNVIAESATDPNYMATATWNSAAATTTTVTLPNISTANNPRFIIKSLGQWNPDKKVSSLDPGFSGYGQTSSALKIDYFKSTAQGYGLTGNTQRTVQSFFGRRSN
jgi:type IV pilus assembly protein PilX